jgi:D-glycerate 3-kinase
MTLAKTLDRPLQEFLHERQLPDQFKQLVTDWYAPLAADLADYQEQVHRPLLVGINGAQGSGKSTLATLLAQLLSISHDRHAIDLSIDDFYLTRATRARLAEKITPMLGVRGVPGTHDMALMHQTLEALLTSSGRNVALPCFDKALDDRCPQEQWRQVNTPIDVVIIEGWCLGTPAQQPSDLGNPVNKLESEEDPDGVWRQYVNQQIHDVYEPVYSMVDIWVMLQAPGFDRIYEWRLEQETKLTDKHNLLANSDTTQSRIMSPQDVKLFIQYYQRLTEHTLAVLPSRVHYRYQLDANREVVMADRPCPVALS